jgi:hypothetical protein
MTKNLLQHNIHVQDGKVLVEITYEQQKLFIPIELVKEFTTSLDKWVSEVLDENMLDNNS